MSLWITWLIVIILLTIIEAMTVDVVTVWFIFSGIVAMITSFFVEDVIVQFAIFVLGGIILLILTKPILKKIINQKKEEATKLDLERIIGMPAIVTEEIKKNVVGAVKVDGKVWSAVSDKKIIVDSEVIVESIDGVKLVVKAKEVPKKETPKKKSSSPKKTTTTKKKNTSTKKKEKEN